MSRLPSIGLRIAVSAAVAVAATLVAGPAHADAAHPDIFTFEAHRTTGDLVSYSGQHATWSDTAAAYVAASGGVSIEDNAPGTTKWRQITAAETDATGAFGGLEHIRWARNLRAVGSTAISQPVPVSYYGPLVSTFTTLQAYQPSRGKPVQITGGFGGWVAYEPQTGDTIGPIQGLTEYASPTTQLLVQRKVHGKWKTAARVTTQAKRFGAFSVSIPSPRSRTWRVVQTGTTTYIAAKSPVFKTSGTRFVGNR